jgi:choline kinase
MRAILLAAGRGSRMKELTQDRPKCLVELRGKALLDWQLDAMRASGIEGIAIVTGYKRELLYARGLVEFHNPRWAETNMVASLACAEEWLRQEPCIVSYTDIFYKPTAIKSLITCPADLAITYDPNWLGLWKRRFDDPLVDAETFRLAPDGTLVEIGNKPVSINDVQGQYMGLLRFTPRGWQEIQRICTELTRERCNKMDMTSVLQKVIEGERLTVAAVPYYDTWGEVDNLKDLLLFEQMGW